MNIIIGFFTNYKPLTVHNILAINKNYEGLETMNLDLILLHKSSTNQKL